MHSKKDNQIGSEGAKALAKSLEDNIMITKLSLHGEIFEKKSRKSLTKKEIKSEMKEHRL